MVDRLRKIGDALYSISRPRQIKEANRRKDQQNQERTFQQKKKERKNKPPEKRLLDTRV